MYKSWAETLFREIVRLNVIWNKLGSSIRQWRIKSEVWAMDLFALPIGRPSRAAMLRLSPLQGGRVHHSNPGVKTPGLISGRPFRDSRIDL